MSLSALLATWREEAQRLRQRYARPDLAALSEAHAAELEEALRLAEDEELTIAEASKEAGRSERTVREWVASGAIPNAGRKHAPRIRRGDLPRRTKRDGSGFDAAAHVQGILGVGQ